MIHPLLRGAGAVVATLIAAVAMLVAVEVFSEIVHPFPPGANVNDFKVCQAHVANYPGWVLAICCALWNAIAWICGWLATRLGPGRHWAPAVICGVLLLAAAVFNMAMLPYPWQFETLTAIGLPLGTISGLRFARPRPAASV